MSLQTYKDREIQKIIDQAFVQFNISDTGERQEIIAAIKAQLDSSKPLSNFIKKDKASSRKYRMDVRNALIDIIAQLLNLQDIEKSIAQLEASSKDLIISTSNKLSALENTFQKNVNNIKETFEEGIHFGYHNGTVIKDGKLRIDKAQLELPLENISVEIHPANNEVDGVVVTTSDNPEVLNKTGLLSDSYHVSLKTPITPSMFITGGYLNGLVVSISFETKEEVAPSIISAKASSECKMQAVYAKKSREEEYTKNLGKDYSLGEYTFVEPTTAEEEYKYFKVFLYFPYYTLKDNIYNYEVNIYNVRLFKTTIKTEDLTGSFVSKKYNSSRPILGAKVTSTHSGDVSFALQFGGYSDSHALSTSNEIFLNKLLDAEDYHSTDEPYVFTLSKIPFMYYKSSSNFTFYIEDKSVIAEDITTTDNSNVVFDPTKKQYYYEKGNLYTNFNLTTKSYTVKYKYTCDGLSLIINLSGYANVDDYTIELITLDDGFSYANEGII